ncbi:fasciclin domain-containing protein [Nocardioides sp.]|uniref:fasciclin domain-containing protein n=1 Tax=Nocardioides sp. TaxID=35761 RepID=UPI002632CBAF|nr:fasciclin domain-containing protein [Nocardioides sp.]MCW2736720.1 Fasciclin protein [Nocardioides sp.]
MKRRVPTLLAASALALGAVSATAPAASANAAKAAPGETSLAGLLTSDGNQFDKNTSDFDIVTEAALAVVGAKPDSPVALLADGSQRLTVFAPTDQAFRLLVKDLTGQTIKSEKKIFESLVALAGVDTIETVLLYHVVPGKTLTSGKVLKSGGAKLATAQGGKVKVSIKKKPSLSITLKDLDKSDQNPKVVLKALDLNKGNKQVAHGIDRVLRPIDL